MRWGLLGGVVCWAVFTLSVLACSPTLRTPPPPPPPPPPIPAPAPPSLPTDPVADLRAQLATLDAERAALASRLRSAEEEARLAPLRALTTWAVWIGGIAAFAGVVGLILLRVGVPWMPVGSKLCVGVALGGLGLVLAATGLASALPWLPVAGLALLAVLVFVGVAWAAVTWKRGGQAAAREWAEYAAALPDDLRAHLDGASRLRQGAAARTVDDLLNRR